MNKIFFLVLLITHCIITSKSVSSREVYQKNPHQLLDNNYHDERAQETPNQLHPHSVHINLDSVYTSKNPHKKPPTQFQQNKSQKSCVSCSENTAPYSLSHAYVKRFVNLILNSLDLDKGANLQLYSGTVNIKLMEDDYMFLKDFAGGLSEENIDNLKKVDSIMTQAFDKSFYERSANWVSSIGNQIFNMMFNKITAVLLCAVFVLSFIYRLIRGNVSTWGIIKCLIFLLYVSDFAVTYLHLLEAAEVEQYIDIKSAGNVPPECDPSKMSYWNYFSYLFKGENPCAKYYKATYENVIYIVVPSKVIKHQITTLLGLMKEFGGAIGDFCGEMFVRLPWGLNIILWPIVLIFFLVMTLINYSTVFNRALKFNFFHLLKLEFGGDRPNGNNGNTDTISGNNLSSLLSSHRKFIETVHHEKSNKISTEENLAIKNTNTGKSEMYKVRKRRSKEKSEKIEDDKKESDKEPKQSKSSLNVQEDNKT